MNTIHNVIIIVLHINQDLEAMTQPHLLFAKGQKVITHTHKLMFFMTYARCSKISYQGTVLKLLVFT